MEVSCLWSELCNRLAAHRHMSPLMLTWRFAHPPGLPLCSLAICLGPFTSLSLSLNLSLSLWVCVSTGLDLPQQHLYRSCLPCLAGPFLLRLPRHRKDLHLLWPQHVPAPGLVDPESLPSKHLLALGQSNTEVCKFGPTVWANMEIRREFETWPTW